ncbi:TPA: hypothetical protein NKX79_004575 [Vibrio parahaemolyticus]|uniref:hypothetical protein n=1 Tax=Vibrio parahaemolyticus TaxID=670 RepID=UPI001C92CF0E|nr:hypothetical protein [Vibrio parahaemolyticus]MBY4651951.1 hypothetical protein [Vibrio parahaemolyticus]HCE4715409.1 hypothetical protein [Vibrio parahaemolyticus]HCG6874943.1 hypothetical protein [Vibrio parahaemolyticus]HCG9364948.1 hypothetical protein [Vibrio parahaemolyticus]HCG9795755.1 hypothetical protein [Vibrio parahaemolyticus]
MKKIENILLTLVKITLASILVLSRLKWLLIFIVSPPFVFVLLYLLDGGFQAKEGAFNADSYMTPVMLYVISVFCYATYSEYLNLTSKGYIFNSIDSYADYASTSNKLIVNYISIAFVNFLLFLLFLSPFVFIDYLEISDELEMLLIFITFVVMLSLITSNGKNVDNTEVIYLPDLRQDKS